ncbi:response regulator [Acidimangrovimonas sediminis]|uniref:response regulator n=1 Tax=Acidimangrovimonas sediminis TaxID=2056283 RepID=UPI000C804BFD|nr:response regulator transcription factor [Acidimangrovimonas sediminis]
MGLSCDPRGLCVGLVDDHPIFRQGLAALLAENMGCAAIHQGATADEAVEIASTHRPDVMFLDLSLPGGGMDALKRIAAAEPEVRCVLLTACDAAASAIEALNNGARGYILKGVGGRELVMAIDTILNDGTFVSPGFAATLLRAAQAPTDRQDPTQHLTQRELQVLHELERGHTNREIALRLDISEKTVKFYMTNIMQKYGVKNRVAAVLAFRASGAGQGAGAAPQP